MGIVTEAKFYIFKEKIYSLQLPLSDKDLLNSNFILHQDEKKKLEVYNTPFDYINENACVVYCRYHTGHSSNEKVFTTVLEMRDFQLSGT